jgi:hypothetical protein
MEIKTKLIIFFIFVLIFETIVFCDDKNEKYFIIKDPKGWNLPYPSYMERTKIHYDLKNISNIFVESYVKRKGYPPYVILNKRIINGTKIDLKEDLSTYQREFVEGMTIFKTEDRKKVVCYRYASLTEGVSALEVVDRLLTEKKLKLIPVIWGNWTGVTIKHVFDCDNDGIFESYLSHSSTYSIEDVLLFIKNIQCNRIPEDLIELKKAWIIGFGCSPTTKSTTIQR